MAMIVGDGFPRCVRERIAQYQCPLYDGFMKCLRNSRFTADPLCLESDVRVLACNSRFHRSAGVHVKRRLTFSAL